MYWKIVLDPEHEYAVEQGSIRSRYAQDFRSTADGMSGTFQCPETGLVMLEPSFRKRSFGNDFKDLGNFRHNTTTANHWRSIARSMDAIGMFSAVRPTGQPKFLDALDVAAGIFVINEADAFFDNLDWALESLFPLRIDEAFAIHYKGLTDELLRKNNWLYVQWDNIGIHFSHQGHVRVLQYADRGDLEGDRVVTHEFDIAEPGELLGKSGQFVFLPIPGYGLMLYHLMGAANFGNIATNTRNYAVRGSHLIPWTARLIGSHFRLFEASLVRLALNPFHSNVLGFQNVTFETEGTYLEQNFDPGYKPSLAPNDVSAGILSNFGGRFSTVTATLRNNTDSGDWAAGTDRQGRVRLNLATSDTTYTPFVYGWGVGWERVTQRRNPGAVEITTNYEESKPNFTSDVLQRLEWTDDSEGHFEGSASLKIQSKAASIIMERGHCTYQIEYSEDGTEWIVLNGGIAKFNKPKMNYHPSWGFFWQVKADLHGQEERFEEVPHNLGTAFDGLTIGECINLCLRTAGFAAIADANMPAALLNIRVPPLQEGSSFRFHPRFGDKMKRILRCLLFLARTQNNEYKMIYDWPNEVWTVVRRPMDLGLEGEEPAWTLNYDPTLEESLDDHTTYYVDPAEFEYQPVEATSFTVVGVAEKSNVSSMFDMPKGNGHLFESTPIRNDAAVTDHTIEGLPNMDYTGREMGVRILATGIASVEEANLIARKINPRFFHRNVLITLMLPPGRFRVGLGPDVRVNVKVPPYFQDMPGDDSIYEMWVKRRTVVIDGEDHGAAAGIANEQMILQVDYLWENPLSIEGGR